MDAMFAGQAAIEVGRLLGRTVTPREITALFYDMAVPDGLGPVVGGRRLTPVLCTTEFHVATLDFCIWRRR